MAQKKNSEKKLLINILPDLSAFIFFIILAWHNKWSADDLIWSLWLSSLTLGYLTFFSAFAGGSYYIIMQKKVYEDSNIGSIITAMGLGLFFLVFFSFHFGAFHAGHASILYGFFPLEELSVNSFGKAFLNPLKLWALVFRHLFRPYAFFLISIIIAERRHVFHHLIMGISAVHTNSPAGKKKSLHNTPENENPLAAVVLRPYINVIRMHMLIFFFAFCEYIKIDNLFIFSTVYAVYFFPWSLLKKSHASRHAFIIVPVLAVLAAAFIFINRSYFPAASEPEDFIASDRIGQDGRFIAYLNGTVIDTHSNLMWADRDNGSHIPWHSARSYCRNYRGGGYSDWRMPTSAELKSLFDKSKGYPYGRQSKWTVHLTDLINLSAPSVWTSERHGSKAFRMNFIYGAIDNIEASGANLQLRVLPVREAPLKEYL